MLDFVNVFLPMILYICGIILLIVLIVLGIKFIGVLDKVDKVVDNIENKVNSLNTAFSLIDKTTDSIVGIGNTVVGAVNGFVSRFTKKKSLEEDEDNE
ncbi:MAG: hypothetical protein Q4E69_05965 [Bacilli bacterium]|nr:hypothetical protein [Bacilli bacterium]